MHNWPKPKLLNLGAGTQLPAIVVDGNTVDSVDWIKGVRPRERGEKAKMKEEGDQEKRK